MRRPFSNARRRGVGAYAVPTALVLAVLASAPTAPLAAQEMDPGARGHDHDRDDDHDHGGFPEFVDVFFTHHAYLERKLHPRLATTVATEANAFETSAELVWEFLPWLGAEVGVPLVWIDPEEGSGASGVGDVEAGPIVAFVRDPDALLIVAVRSAVVLPTGDEDEGLGIGGWGWEPGLVAWKGFGPEGRGALQAEAAYERVFADEADDEEELAWNLALSYRLPSRWIPIVELNGATPLGEDAEEHHEEPTEARIAGLVPAHGDVEAGGEGTLVAVTIGFRYAFENGQQWGAGVQLPLNDDPYDARVVVGGIAHLD